MTPEEIAQLSNSELKTAMLAVGLTPKSTPFDLEKLPKPSRGAFAKSDIDRILAENLDSDIERWRRELVEHFRHP